tara:strand:- start:1607 stop:2206 length:600 start_codon:yes stop_codon:yes gene_type:complete
MEHFVRVVMEKQDEINSNINEGVFPGMEILESEQGATVIHIPLARELSENEADEYADKLVAMMSESGYEDFDIEISSDQDLEEVDEETYEDDDDFFEEYGVLWYNEDDDPIDEAEYRGRKVKLGKPMAGDVKKFKVYVKDPKTGNVKKVNFGHGGSSVKGKSMRIRKNNPAARRSFRARHNCDNPGPRTKARYWSCRKW